MTTPKRTQLADIHNHLTPAVDDGSRSIEESLRHLRTWAADGATRVAVSPHLNGTLVHKPGALEERLAVLRAGFDALSRACEGRDDVPELRFGQEILVPTAYTAEALFSQPGVGLEHTPYVLIEFGFHLGADPVEVIEAILSSGRRPVVGHPERYLRDGAPVTLETIRRWKEAGAVLQVNDGSILGGYGPVIEELAWRMIREGLTDLLSSDSHADYRPVSLAETWQALVDHGAADSARLLMSENPQRVLRGEETLRVGAQERAA